MQTPKPHTSNFTTSSSSSTCSSPRTNSPTPIRLYRSPNNSRLLLRLHTPDRMCLSGMTPTSSCNSRFDPTWTVKFDISTRNLSICESTPAYRFLRRPHGRDRIGAASECCGWARQQGACEFHKEVRLVVEGNARDAAAFPEDYVV